MRANGAEALDVAPSRSRGQAGMDGFGEEEVDVMEGERGDGRMIGDLELVEDALDAAKDISDARLAGAFGLKPFNGGDFRIGDAEFAEIRYLEHFTCSLFHSKDILAKVRCLGQWAGCRGNWMPRKHINSE